MKRGNCVFPVSLLSLLLKIHMFYLLNVNVFEFFNVKIKKIIITSTHWCCLISSIRCDTNIQKWVMMWRLLQRDIFTAVSIDPCSSDLWSVGVYWVPAVISANCMLAPFWRLVRSTVTLNSRINDNTVGQILVYTKAFVSYCVVLIVLCVHRNCTCVWGGFLVALCNFRLIAIFSDFHHPVSGLLFLQPQLY